MSHFGRVVTAMITPFTSDKEIDFEKTTILINHLIENGTDAIVVAGTTGESPTLAKEEKLRLFAHVVEVVKKRVPVIAGTGSNDTKTTIELTKKAESLGVDAIMLVVPYYNKPSQAGMIAHFKEVASHTKLPIMLYNIPGRTGVNMFVNTVVELSKVPNIVAIKEASGDINQMSRIIANTDESFELYSGDDGITLPVLSIGGVGVVSVASHVIGNELQKMVQLFQEGKNKEAATIHHSIIPKVEALFTFPNPVPLKTILKEIDLDMGDVRLPLVSLTDEEKQKVIKSFF